MTYTYLVGCFKKYINSEKTFCILLSKFYLLAPTLLLEKTSKIVPIVNMTNFMIGPMFLVEDFFLNCLCF